MSDSNSGNDTKACPFCGETIKAVAIRCKHCQADLTRAPQAPDFDRGQAAHKAASSPPPATPSEHEFELRFLDFAYQTDEILTPISVAHALKLPIAYCDDRLEALAAADRIRREVDDEGNVYFELPGQAGQKARARQDARARQYGAQQTALVRQPTQQQGETALARGGTSTLELPDPGDDVRLTPASGPPPTEAQAVAGLVLNLCIPGVGSLVAGKPGPGITQLAMLIAGLPLCFVLVGFPIVFAAWLWALMTGVQALQEAKSLSAPPV